MAGVLEGIRVLDFGRYVAGPHCASFLGDFGAQVIRIEKVDGSEDRFLTPLSEFGDGANFVQSGRNKLGMTLNPNKPEGKEIMRRLIETADVVVVNVPVDALKAMQLDYESLVKIKKDIILTTCSAFGSQGSYANKLGFDGIGQAMSGNMHMSGHPDGPMKSYGPFVDVTSGILCALGTMMALYERRDSGCGQIVEGSLIATALNITNTTLMEQAALQLNRVATGNRGQSGAPSDVFKMLDGWIQIQVLGKPLFKRWTELMDEPHWLEDPRFKDDKSRGDNGEILSERMARWCADKTVQEAMDILEEAGIPAGEVLSPQQCLDHPYMKETGLFHYMKVGDVEKPVPFVRTPIKLSRTPGEIKTPPPTLGEHTDRILQSLGYSAQEIAGFHERRVV